MPLLFNIRTPSNFSDAFLNTNEHIEGFFLEYYSMNNGENLELLIAEIKKDNSITKWLPLIDDCYVAYRNGHKMVVVPALIAVIEGIQSQKIGILRTGQTKMIAPTRTKANQAHPTEIDSILWKSVLAVTEKLYMPSNFASEKPDFINRHWILHGRDSSEWGDIECIRLFNYIGSLTIV